MRGGFVSSGSLGYIGTLGDYWSTVCGSDAKAYYLDFYGRIVRPSHFDYRYHGLSLRCVAIGS